MGIRKTIVAVAAGLALLAQAPGLVHGSAGQSRKAEGTPARKDVSDNTVLAEVNGEKVRVGQLREWMRRIEYRHARTSMGDKRAREAAFGDLVHERLILQKMRFDGKADSEEFRGPFEAGETISLANRLLRTYRREILPGDNEVRARLPDYFRELDLRIFFGPTFGEASKARERVLAGENFEEIARAGSVGPGAEKGGLLKGYRSSSSVLPESIERQAFSADEGWLSPVYETPLGYAFVRVEGIRDETPDRIAEKAVGAIDSARSEAARRMIDQAEEEAKITLDNAVLRELDGLPSSRWKERFRESVATVGGEQVTVRDFYWFVHVVKKKEFPEPGAGELFGLAQSFTRVRAFAGKAREKGMDREPWYEEGARRYSEPLLTELFRDEAARSVRVDGKEARKFFERNLETWKRPPGREIRDVSVKNADVARSLAAQFRERPADIDRFAASRMEGMGAGKGRIVYRGRMSPEEEKFVFGAPVGEVSGPHQAGDSWVIFIVDRDVPPVEKPRFEDNEKEAREGAREEKVARTIRETKERLYRDAAIITMSKVLDSVEW
jgi:parvulin-like peptidyl-prolyl isomerase